MPEDTEVKQDQHVDHGLTASTDAEKLKDADAPPAAEAPPSLEEKAEAEGAKENVKSVHEDKEPISTEEPAEAAVEKEDLEMEDASVDGKEAAVVPNGTTVTPTSKKATSNGSSKKKSSGVPEHKTKKLNRKKSKMELHLHCKPGELYLARMKGHPAWPSVICDEAMLPAQLLNTRPVTTALADGTFKKPEYADGGKRAHERTFPIMFLYTNEFAWMPNTDLTPITADDCKDVPEKGKTKALYEAYQVAAEGYDLEHWKKILADHQEALNEDAERRAEREAKKAEKAEKARRKSEVAEKMDIDDEEEERKPKTKKRKKSMDAEDSADEKPAKTPKTTQRIKLNAPKTPTSESSKKKTPSKPKSSSKKAAAKAASDEELVDTPMVEEKPLDPAEAKEKKEKEIRYYRHKLQKGFINRDDVPSNEEIISMSTYLAKLESYPELEASIIRATKIHKVLKAMIKLNSIPKDEEFNFKNRSMVLLKKWNDVLAVDQGGEKDDTKKDDPEVVSNEKAAEKADVEHEIKSEDQAETNGVAKEPEPEASGALREPTKDELTDKPNAGAEGEKEVEKPAETAVDKIGGLPPAEKEVPTKTMATTRPTAEATS